MNELIVSKFNLMNYNDDKDIFNIQNKSKIIIIDKQENSLDNSKKPDYFYSICFDYNLVYLEEKDIEYLKLFLSKNSDSDIYCFTEDIKEEKQNSKISYINSDNIFTDVIKNFEENLLIKVIQELNDTNIISFWKKIRRTISAFLIKKAYSNSKFDVIYHCKEIFTQKVTEIQMKEEEFIKIGNLGHGYTNVYLIYHIKHEKLYAMKIYTDPEEKNALRDNELSIYRNISHPLIPRFIGTVEKYPYPNIVIDFLDGITLKEIDKKNFSREDKIHFLFEILVIFKYIHSKGYLYIDLKPNNIFIDCNFHIFLIDFDRMIHESSIRQDKEIYRDLCPRYVAPEIAKTNSITQKVDIFSIGKIIEFMFLNNNCTESEDNSKLEVICNQCKEQNPKSRPDISQLIEDFYNCFLNKISTISEIETIKSIIKINSNESFSFLIFLAESQNAHAQYFLGEFYEKRKYFVKNSNKAIHYFLLSAKQNNANAIEKLKKMFEKVDLIQLDINLKIQYFEFFAKQDHSEAQYKLGIIYYENQNLGDSIHYLLLSAKQNNINAREKLKKIFFEFDLSKLDDKLMIQYLEFAANENISEAEYLLGILYSEGKHVNQCFLMSHKYLSRAANHGHVEAQYQLGILLYEKLKQVNSSILYFLLSANQNNLKAKEKLKEIFEKVDLNKLSLDLKIEYLTFVSDENISEAQYQLGVLYFEGKQVNKDIQKSKHYLTLAANQNHQKAQHLLASMHPEKTSSKDNHYFKLASDSKTNNNEENNEDNNKDNDKNNNKNFKINDMKKHLTYSEMKKKIIKLEETLKNIEEYGKNKGYYELLKHAADNSDDNKNRTKEKISKFFDLVNSNDDKSSTKESFSEKIINIIDNFDVIFQDEIKGEEHIYQLLNIIKNIINENNYYINNDETAKDRIIEWILEIIERIRDESSLVSNLKNFIIFLQKFFSNKLYNTAIHYYDGNEGEEKIYESIDYFKKAANYGHSDAQYHLGIIYSEDKIVKRNINEAIKYFSLASIQNHSEAQYQLGIIYYEKQNHGDSIHYFLLSANQNNLKAKEKLKEIFEKVDLNKLSLDLKIEYLNFVADENISEAQYQLGVLYFEGKQVNKDIQKSKHYLTLAANQNHQEAQHLLASMHSEEIYSKDNHYFKLASDRKTNNNEDNNEDNDENFKINDMEKYLTYLEMNEEIITEEILEKHKGCYELLKHAADNSDDNKNRTKEKISKFFDLVNSNDDKSSTKESFSEKIINIIDNFDVIFQDEIKGEEHIYQLLNIIKNIINENNYYINNDETAKDRIIQWISEIIERIRDESSLISNLKNFIIFLQKFFSNKLYNTAIHYYDGNEGEEKIYESIDYFKKAANYGHSDAQYHLGIIFSEDKIVKRNINEAIKYFQLASIQNHSKSQYQLGMIYYNGYYAQRNIKKAIDNLLMAANQNHSEAQYQLGMFYYETQKLEDSIHYLLLSTGQNNENAKEKLKEMFEKVDLSKLVVNLRIEYLKFLSNENISEAQYQLGVLYLEGILVHQNIEKSVDYLSMAADQNHAESQYQLGLLYLEGKLVHRNVYKSHDYFKRASQKHHCESLYQLGILYYEGIYVEKNILEAKKCFSIASRKNHTGAKYFLGMIFYEGEYVDRNITKAISYLTQAADQNYYDAQYQLGMIYYENQNLEDSINKAIHYLLLSANQKNERSKTKLKEIFEKVDLNKLNIDLRNHYLKFAADENVSEAQYQFGLLYLDRDIKISLDYLKKASNQNHVESQYQLGMIHYKGKHITKDIEKAILYLQSAAKHKHREAQYRLGTIYQKGKDIERDIDKAIFYLQSATEQNHSESQYQLGLLYYRKRRVRDIDKSVKYLLMAANQKHLEAQYLLGKIYYKGKYIEKDIEKAILYFQSAAKQNHAEALYQLGMINYEGKYIEKDIEEAIKYFQSAANQNHLESQYRLGKYYLKMGSIPNIDKSLDYLSIAANQNHAKAQYRLGIIYYKGKYTERDIEKTIFYLQSAAEQNHVKAQYQLGIIYYEGKYIEKDIKKSIFYLQLATEQNHPESQYQLGIIFYEGKDIERDIEKTILCFQAAAEQNHVKAQYQLGMIYSEGKYIEKDIIKSIFYLQKATEQNHSEAQYQLGMINYENQKLEDSIRYFLLSTGQNNENAKEKLKEIFEKVDLSDLDFDLMIEYLEFLSDEKVSEAQYQLGFLYYKKKRVRDIDKSVKYFLMAAKQNHSEAQYQLGMINYENQKLEDSIRYFLLSTGQNNEKAKEKLKEIFEKVDLSDLFVNLRIEYLKFLSDENISEAQYQIGLLYYKIKRVRDIDKSVEYLLMAANQNHVEAQYQLGIIFYEGKDIERDIEKTILCFQAAAEQNHAEAQFQLGMIYYEGKYIKKDIKKSIFYLQKATDQNHPKSQYQLGKIYFKGDRDVDRDIKKAIEYLSLAAKQKNLDAQLLLADIYSKGIFVAKDISKAIRILNK